MEKQILKEVIPEKVAKELAQVVESVTCLECCKFYILPETAICGHTLCHGCWIGRQTCPVCALPLRRRTLRANALIKKYTESVQKATMSFEKEFNIKIEEFAAELSVGTINKVVERDPNKNVNAWLCDSQNHFSAPVSTQASAQAESPTVEVKACEIQVHTGSRKPPSPTKIIHAPPPPQDDWDKIESVPDTEEFIKNKENVGPVDFAPFCLDDEEYTTDHPRRSSRKRELKNESKPSETSADKHSSSNMSTDMDKLSRAKQNWSNVKKMRKEFSKLHKKNKNKLNISIEMCKKTKSAMGKSASKEETESEKVITIEDLASDIKEAGKETSPVPERITIDSNNKHGCEEENKKSPENITHTDLDSFQVLDTNQDNKNKSNSFGHKTNSSSILSNFVDVSNHEKELKSNETDEKPISRSNIPFLKKSTLQNDKPTDNSKNSSEVVVGKVQQNVQTVNHVVDDNVETDSDDIQITIKIGSTLTNIFIKKKKNDVKVKLNTDQAVQTSRCMEKSTSCNTSVTATKICDVQNIEINIGSNSVVCAIPEQTESIEASANCNKMNLDKTVSTKKNTASAETVPVEITASLEKELSKIMECDDNKNGDTQKCKSQKSTEKVNQDADKISAPAVSNKELNTEDIELDEDLFASGSVKENNVQLLKATKPAPSEILMPTSKQYKKHTQTQRQAKRNRENDHEITSNKKLKVTGEVYESSNEDIANEDKDESSVNYDSVMGQVFASIDAEMVNVDKSQSIIKDNNQDSTLTEKQAVISVVSQHSQLLKTQKTQKKVLGLSKLGNATQNIKSNLQQKDSESLFALSNIESQAVIEKGQNQKHGPETQAHLDNLLTPGMCRDLAATQPDEVTQANGQDVTLRPTAPDCQDDARTQATARDCHGDPRTQATAPDCQGDVRTQATARDCQGDVRTQATAPGCHGQPRTQATAPDCQGDVMIQATPQERDDSDTSVCEETPQKASSFTKRSNAGSIGGQQPKQTANAQRSQLDANEAQLLKEIIDISDTEHTKTDKDITDVAKPKQTLETPTINQFYSSIQHNSTPVARKSLNFATDEPLSSRNIINSQELFPKPRTPQAVPRYCVAASCLTSAEVRAVEMLCARKNWQFVKEYTNELTHLIVGVDEDGRSQRTVKFMCALAAGKWIVRYEWADTWLRRGVAQEEQFEAFDWTGEPGPRRARTAARKLFHGFTFYCMPPFSVLSEPVLKTMLESAGGRVVSEPRDVRVEHEAGHVRLLLAEPEHTQENRFTYMALHLGIVPVNYEWALNCLGSYTLSSILDLMLCPSTLLPAATSSWPPVIITEELDESE